MSPREPLLRTLGVSGRENGVTEQRYSILRLHCTSFHGKPHFFVCWHHVTSEFLLRQHRTPSDSGARASSLLELPNTIYLWFYSHFCWTLASFSVSWSYTQSVGLFGRGISPSKGRCLHTEQTHRDSMPRVGFEPMIPAFERAKTVHALDGAATVIGTSKHRQSWKPVAVTSRPNGETMTLTTWRHVANRTGKDVLIYIRPALCNLSTCSSCASSTPRAPFVYVWLSEGSLKCCPYTKCVTTNVRTIYERWIGKDLDGSGHGIIEALSRHLPGETGENHESPQYG
jgi:hypothetical protein